MTGETPVLYCEKGLPRSLGSLAMTDKIRQAWWIKPLH